MNTPRCHPHAVVASTAFPVGSRSLRPDPSMNFQMNRWFGWVGEPDMLEEMRTVAPRIVTYDDWQREFVALAELSFRAGPRPQGGVLVAVRGVLHACLGLYFALLRPPPLPEDLRSTGASLASIQATAPGLLVWLQRVFRVMGGFMFAAGVLTVYVSTTGLRERAQGAFLAVALAGVSSIGLMVVVNFLIDPDFKCLLVASALPWVCALVLYRIEPDGSRAAAASRAGRRAEPSTRAGR